MSYTTQLTENDEEHLFMPIPEELLQKLNWKENDTVIFEFDKESGAVAIKLKSDSESNSNAT